MYIDTNKLKDKKLIDYLENINYSLNYGIFDKGKSFTYFDEDFEKLKEGLFYIFNYLEKYSYNYGNYILIQNEGEPNEG